MQMQVNLLPIQYRPKPSVRLWPILLTVLLMLNLFTTSTYWLTLQLEITEAESSVSSLQTEVSSLQRQIGEAEWKSELEERVKEKADYVSLKEIESVLWHPLFLVVEQAMVPGITLTGLNCSSDGTVSLSGTTESVKTASEFLGSLQRETGLEVILLHGVVPEGGFQITMKDWYGREVQEDE